MFARLQEQAQRGMISSGQTFRERVKMKDAATGKTNFKGGKNISDTDRGLKETCSGDRECSWLWEIEGKATC